jgi:hypothetical protein
LKRKRQRKLAAQRIAVWTNMTQDCEPPMRAQYLANFLEPCSAHLVSAARFVPV